MNKQFFKNMKHQMKPDESVLCQLNQKIKIIESENNKKVINNKRNKIKYVFPAAAAVVVVSLATVILGKSFHKFDTVNPGSEAIDITVSENNLVSANINESMQNNFTGESNIETENTSSKVYLAPPWSQFTIYEKYCEFTIDDYFYTTLGKVISKEYVGEQIDTVTMRGYSEDNSVIELPMVPIYKINTLEGDKNLMVAVQLEDNYYVYYTHQEIETETYIEYNYEDDALVPVYKTVQLEDNQALAKNYALVLAVLPEDSEYRRPNSDYLLGNLGELVSAYNLQEYMTFNNNIDVMNEADNTSYNLSFNDNVNAKIWEIINNNLDSELQQFALYTVKEPEDTLSYRINFSIDYTLSGITDMSIFFTSSGYLFTNLTHYFSGYYIGEETVEQLKLYIDQNCRPQSEQHYTEAQSNE